MCLKVLGIIGSIAMAFFYGRKNETDYYINVTYTREWIQTIIILIGCIVGVIILYIILSALSEILYNQERLLYQISCVSKENKIIKSNVETNVIPRDSWRCSKCDKINPNYTGTCSCGGEKPN